MNFLIIGCFVLCILNLILMFKMGAFLVRMGVVTNETRGFTEALWEDWQKKIPNKQVAQPPTKEENEKFLDIAHQQAYGDVRVKS